MKRPAGAMKSRTPGQQFAPRSLRLRPARATSASRTPEQEAELARIDSAFQPGDGHVEDTLQAGDEHIGDKLFADIRALGRLPKEISKPVGDEQIAEALRGTP